MYAPSFQIASLRIHFVQLEFDDPPALDSYVEYKEAVL